VDALSASSLEAPNSSRIHARLVGVGLGALGGELRELLGDLAVGVEGQGQARETQRL
jgi:hypothetical protein